MKILVTGVAGSGKTTLSKKLTSMGYEAYDIEDVEGMFDMYRKDTGELYKGYTNTDPEMIKNADWLCNVEKLKEFLANQKNETAFYCGVASNMDDVIPLFDKVVVLSAQPDKIHARLKTREGTEDIGNTEEGRQAVLGWKDWWESEMQDKGGILVSASEEIDEVALKVLEVSK